MTKKQSGPKLRLVSSSLETQAAPEGPPAPPSVLEGSPAPSSRLELPPATDSSPEGEEFPQPNPSSAPTAAVRSRKYGSRENIPHMNYEEWKHFMTHNNRLHLHRLINISHRYFTKRELTVLNYLSLAQPEHEGLNVAKLARILGCDNSNTARVVRKLASEGLILNIESLNSSKTKANLVINPIVAYWTLRRNGDA